MRLTDSTVRSVTTGVLMNSLPQEYFRNVQSCILGGSDVQSLPGNDVVCHLWRIPRQQRHSPHFNVKVVNPLKQLEVAFKIKIKKHNKERNIRERTGLKKSPIHLAMMRLIMIGIPNVMSPVHSITITVKLMVMRTVPPS